MQSHGADEELVDEEGKTIPSEVVIEIDEKTTVSYTHLTLPTKA